MNWTDERIATLTKMWEGGATASQIADELGGVSRNAVIGKAHRLGLKSRPSPVKPNEEKAAPKKAADQAPAAKAKAKGKYLFVWGKEAATYYLTMALDSAIKEGGLDVMNAVNNLEKNAWSQKPIQDVFAALEKIVAAGYFVPGGAGTQFTAAQAKWSNDQQAILYPSGGWIENEMKKATADNFKMTGAPEPTVSNSPATDPTMIGAPSWKCRLAAGGGGATGRIMGPAAGPSAVPVSPI